MPVLPINEIHVMFSWNFDKMRRLVASRESWDQTHETSASPQAKQSDNSIIVD